MLEARSSILNVLYGDGPTGHPFLYQRDDPAKFLLGVGRSRRPTKRRGHRGYRRPAQRFAHADVATSSRHAQGS